MPVPRVLVLLAALTATGCASVMVHGIVRDEQGQPVPIAVAKVTDAATGAAVVAGDSNANGCLDLFELVKGHQQSFVLRIDAPGFREAVLAFSRREELTLLVTLTAAEGAAESSIRRIPWDEQATTYRLYCVPEVPPAAGRIGLR